jgi:hypothetical protein
MAPLRDERISQLANALKNIPGQFVREAFESLATDENVLPGEMDEQFHLLVRKITALRQDVPRYRYTQQPCYIFKHKLTCREQAKLCRGICWYGF